MKFLPFFLNQSCSILLEILRLSSKKWVTPLFVHGNIFPRLQRKLVESSLKQCDKEYQISLTETADFRNT